jgi:hypothetical protein
MVCKERNCECRGECHRKCPADRSVCGIPVVSGEVGRGPYGLWRTIPQALASAPAVIVHGHGLFAVGGVDFGDAFRTLLSTENACRREYFRRIDSGSP